jgi:hypothetical protein
MVRAVHNLLLGLVRNLTQGDQRKEGTETFVFNRMQMFSIQVLPRYDRPPPTLSRSHIYSAVASSTLNAQLVVRKGIF